MTEPTRDPQQRRRRQSHRRPVTGLRTVREYSAGGLVVDGLDRETQVAALIRTVNRRGRTRWRMPKGHIEIGEEPEQTAIREIAEETGIYGALLAPLGVCDYWFPSEGSMVHKTVHHYLLRFVDGELCADDHEVEDVAWVPLDELSSRLTHANERELGLRAARLVAELHTYGAVALPPLTHSPPRLKSQTHSRAHNSADPTRPSSTARRHDAGPAT